MKELRPLPLHPGQTDLFGDPAFAGVGISVDVAAARAAKSGLHAGPVTGYPSNGLETKTKTETDAPAVTKQPRRRTSRKGAATAAEKQSHSRSVRRKKGLRRLELWVPGAIKDQCRTAARRGKTTMDRVAGALLAAAFSVAGSSPAKGTP